MTPAFSEMMKSYNTPMNESIMRGLATDHMKHFEEYLDAQIRSICSGMPPCVKYIGYTRCTPDEEFAISTKPKNTKRFFELARTYKYLINLHFQFIDNMGVIHDLERPIYLPFCTEGGIIYIAGTEMHLVPVLSDKIFTPGQDSIFVRLIQDRNYIYRTYHTVIVNGRRESKYVAHSDIYRNKDKSKVTAQEKTTKAKNTLTHYLLARYGFEGAFKRYIGFMPEIGDERTISPATHPSSEYIIYESTRVQPKKSNIDKDYKGSRIRFAVKKADWTHAVECLIVGMLYVIDHFPDRFTPRFRDDRISNYAGILSDFETKVLNNDPSISDAEIEEVKTKINKEYFKLVNDAMLWRILIGHIRFSGSYQENRLLASIGEHFETIETYLDTAVKVKLQECGIHLENYFDLLHYVQVNFERFIAENERNGLSVYGKSLEILQYVAYDILSTITKMKFNINKIYSRGDGLSLRDVSDPLRRTVRMGAIFSLGKGNKLVCEPVSYGGDHMYPKITAVVAQQENRAGGGRATEKRIVPGPEHRLDLSMIFMGSILNTPKSHPTPVVRVNPYITIDHRSGTVIPNPKFSRLVNKYSKYFRL